MMKNAISRVLIIGLVLMGSLQVFAEVVVILPQNDPLLPVCKDLINSGSYGNGQMEQKCNTHFDLPSPFLIKCLSYEETGYPSLDLQYENIFPKDWEEEACHLFWQKSAQKVFREYADYSWDQDLPVDLLETYYKIKDYFLSESRHALIQAP